MRVVLEDYGHYATGRKPREGEDALLVLDEFSRPRLGRGQRHQPGRAGPRRRRPGRRRRPERRRPRRPPPGPPAAGLLCRRDRRPPVPGPRAAAGPGRDGPHPGAQLGAGPLRPPRVGQGPHGGPAPDRPRAVRQAQPGEAWVIQAGQSIHLRVLPPPAVAPEPVEPTATLPLADDTMPLPAVEEPAPVGIAAAVALAGRTVRRAGQRVGPAAGAHRAAALPGPAAVAGRAAPAGSGAAMRPPAGTGLACGAAPGNPEPRTRTGRLPAGRAATWPPPASRALRSLRPPSLRDGLRPPLTRPSSRRPGETRSPGAGEEQRPTSRQEAQDRGADPATGHPHRARRHLLTRPQAQEEEDAGHPDRTTTATNDQPAAPRAPRRAAPWPTPTSPSPAT